MQEAIQYIQEQLRAIYPETEIQSFTRWILESVCGLKPRDYFLCKDKKLSEKEVLQIREVVAGLREQKPIQYLLGETEFYGLPFRVDPSVLIPRPETEELVERILLHFSQINEAHPFRILDIGTGSGCIPVALAKHLPQAKIHAVDISEAALSVARQNADRNGVNIQLERFDILQDDFASVFPEKWDAIVSNPPYVTPSEKGLMSANVLENEPHVALFVPEENPLLFYDRIADLALSHLEKNGRLYFETSALHGQSVVRLLEAKGFGSVHLIRDISGKDRIVEARL